jgi:hypothetical protein
MLNEMKHRARARLSRATQDPLSAQPSEVRQSTLGGAHTSEAEGGASKGLCRQVNEVTEHTSGASKRVREVRSE